MNVQKCQNRNLLFFSDENDYSQSKEAIRKRKYREEKESNGQADIRRAKDNAAKKKKNDDKTPEQKKASKAANAARMREKRKVDKMANNTQNQGLREFQSIQTIPRALQVTKSLSHETRLPHRNDGTLSSGSGLNEDSMSEYEKIRLRNIEERKQKFEELFGTNNPFGGEPSANNQKRGLPKSNMNSESSDEEIRPTVEPTRRQPKRLCKSLPKETPEHSILDSSFEGYVDDLVESAIANVEIGNLTQEIEQDVHDVNDSHKFAKIPIPKKRKPNIGRKTKTALKLAQYRESHESQQQYEARLEQSSNLKSKMKKLDNGVHHDRKLEILKDRR